MVILFPCRASLAPGVFILNTIPRCYAMARIPDPETRRSIFLDSLVPVRSHHTPPLRLCLRPVNPHNDTDPTTPLVDAVKQSLREFFTRSDNSWLLGSRKGCNRGSAVQGGCGFVSSLSLYVRPTIVACSSTFCCRCYISVDGTSISMLLRQ